MRVASSRRRGAYSAAVLCLIPRYTSYASEARLALILYFEIPSKAMRFRYIDFPQSRLRPLILDRANAASGCAARKGQGLLLPTGLGRRGIYVAAPSTKVYVARRCESIFLDHVGYVGKGFVRSHTIGRFHQRKRILSTNPQLECALRKLIFPVYHLN